MSRNHSNVESLQDHPIVQHQASARNAARKLYFFKAPSERTNIPGSRKSEIGASEVRLMFRNTLFHSTNNSDSINLINLYLQLQATNVLDSKDKPPSQAPKAKSLVAAKAKPFPTAPALSSRELMAIEKHVQSMKRSNRKSIS
jgi:hypothetical protein